MKNILILGHTGFVGNSLKLFLEKKFCNVLILRDRSKQILENSVKKANIIINCVGENYDTSLMNQSNYIYVKKILEIIYKYNKNIFLIHISSCSVYGELFHKNIKFVDENSITKPISFYSITKLNAELEIKKAYENKKIKNYLIIRPSQIIGINMKSSTYLNLIKYVKNNIFFYLSNMKSVRNYIHVNDFINFIWFVCKNQRNFRKKNKLIIISKYIKLRVLINYIKKKLKIKSKQLIMPKFFITFITIIIKFLYPKFPLSIGIISGLSSNVIIRDNIKKFKINFDICNDYIKYVIK
jgi:nucleoside-diphosphate-sugar epimerase